MTADVVGTAVALALTASVAYGISDVVSGVVVRRHTAAAVALWAQLTGLVLIGAAVVVRRPDLELPGLSWAAAAGALGSLAVLAFYTALQNGPITIVAPVAGAGVVVPLVIGSATGERVGTLAVLGLIATVAGVLTVSLASGAKATSQEDAPPWHAKFTPGRAHPVPVSDGCGPVPHRRPGPAAVLLAVGAAVGFGGFFVLLDRATRAAGGGGTDEVLLVGIGIQIGAFAVTMLAASRHTLKCLRPTSRLLLLAASIGVLDLGADLLLTVATSNGPLTLVGPLGSLDPVVVVLLALVLLRERVNRYQAVGVGLTLTGIALVVL
ncbi:EamA family transporter [Kribbella sp. CA-293567]|uniref:EamA family transporter n=1 Tax=Kribbella sp. CA-293567 TaxID=3002436 RepID=UPI0022DDBE97|nr:EamA family transporter [Kribbella sp. CA-293567]WBQ08399.1 EamA family transporter [Kribbella sp. CA-293567]